MTNIQQDRELGLAIVTIDSSLMYPATSRRFLMALWEMDSLRIELVPRAVKEMYGFIAESEDRHWRTLLRKQGERTGKPWDPATIDAIASAASEAAQAWVNEELGFAGQPGRNDSMLSAVEMRAEQANEAARIAETIPKSCFKGPTKDNWAGDRRIIGESIVNGFKILASDNRSSIRRAQMNGWLRERGYAQTRMILRADDAIEEAGQWQEQPQRMLEATLRATLPSNRGTARREDEIVRNFIRWLKGQGMPGVAETCEEEWTGPQRTQVYERAREHIAGWSTLARTTEDRRRTAVQAAAQKAGWTRE